MPLITRIDKALIAKVEKIRCDIHQHPELGFEEKRTARLVAEHLRRIGLDEVKTGVARTGVVGLLRGGRKGRTVALRADMDALPITEETGLPYASVNKGVMHACGHDGHTAVLIGVAEFLTRIRKDIPGNVKFIFQPGEEGGAGGKRMVEEGVLLKPKVDAIFAQHAWYGNVPPGRIMLDAIPTVGVNGFRMDIFGKGGHGARPHSTVDPVIIAAHIITSCQTIASREISPDRPVVLSFCSVAGGTKSNIIPDSAVILGTIRAMDMKTMKQVRAALARIAGGVAKSLRGRVRITDEELYPPLFNDAELVKLVAGVAEDLYGRGAAMRSPEQGMGGEDFAFYLKDQGGVPGVLFKLGVGSKENLHTSRFNFGPAAIGPGILLMANVALRYLEQ